MCCFSTQAPARFSRRSAPDREATTSTTVATMQPIPTTLDQVDAQWLTDTLRSAGRLAASTTVTSTAHELLGVGEGFMGELARIDITHDGADAIGSVIVKIPTTVEENRGAGQLLGIYEREVRAYQDLLPRIDVPSPAVHAALLSPEATGAADAERLAKADRLPIWLLRIMMKREMKTGVVPPALLLLEDIRDAECGDQVAGCSPERAAAVMRVAARMHASTWNSRVPDDCEWLTRGDIAPRIFHAVYLTHRREFGALVGDWISPHSLGILREIKRSGLQRIRDTHHQVPLCVLHGDFRLDNMFFAAEADVRAVIDWQIPGFGPAALDLGYFLVGSLDASTPESVIDELLGVYHDELVAAGVDDYSFAQLCADYVEGLLIILHRAVATFGALDLGEERGLELVKVWIDRFDARLARVPA